MGVCLSKGNTKDGDNITNQPTPRRVGAIFPAKQSRHKLESIGAEDVGARLEARKPPKAEEAVREEVPNTTGEPKEGDSQEALQASRPLQDVAVTPNGMPGDATQVCPDPGTVEPDRAAVDPGSVEHKHPGTSVDSTAAPVVVPSDPEGAGTKDYSATAESDSLADDSTSGHNLMRGEAADKEPSPQQLPLNRLPELAALGLQLHADSPQASERSLTDGSTSAQDSDADDEVTGMLRQDSYQSDQRHGRDLPDGPEYTESLILSAPQDLSSGRSTPRAEPYDCITASHDAPLDMMWAQAFKLGDVITVDGSTPGEVQGADVIFEDAQQPIASPVAHPPGNKSGRGEGLDASGKELAQMPGEERESPALLELPSADHAGPSASSASHPAPDAVSCWHVIPEEKQDAGSALVLKLEDEQPSSLFWSFTPGVDTKCPTPLTSPKNAAMPPSSLLAGGGARADLDEESEPVAAIDDVKQVLDVPKQQETLSHNLDEGGVEGKKAKPMGTSAEQGSDGWTIGAKHAGGLEAAQAIVAPAYTSSGAATPIHNAKTGDSKTLEAAAVSGIKLKDLLAINPFEDDETPAEQGPHEFSLGTKPNETLKAANPIEASAIVSPGAASHLHSTEPGEYSNGNTRGTTPVEASACGSQILGQTADPEQGVDLDTAVGTDVGSTENPISGHASEDKALASPIGVAPSPIDGRVLGYERDQAARDVLANAGEVEGITRVSPLTNHETDLESSEGSLASERCEDLPKLTVEGAPPSHECPGGEPMAPEVVQQDSVIGSSQALPEAHTLSEAAIDDALSATITSVLWSSPDTIGEVELEPSHAQLLAPAQPEKEINGTSGAETSVDEPYVAVVATGEHEIQGIPPSPIKGMPIDFEPEAHCLEVIDEMTPGGGLPVSLPSSAIPIMPDADEGDTLDASTAPFEGGPPSPVEGIQVMYEAAADGPGVTGEKALVGGFTSPVQPASPTMSEADIVETSDDNTATVEGGPPSPVEGIQVIYEAAADGPGVTGEKAYVGGFTSPVQPPSPTMSEADNVETSDDSTATVEGYAGSGHMNDSPGSTTSPTKGTEVAKLNDTAASGSEVSRASGATVSNVPSVNLPGIVQEMLGQDFAPTGKSEFHSAGESGYESDSEGGLLSPEQPHVHAAQSHVDQEEVGGADATGPPHGLQELEGGGQDLGGSKMLGGGPEAAMGNLNAQERLAVMEDSDPLSGQVHQGSHTVDTSADLAGSLVSRSEHHDGLGDSLLDEALAFTSAEEPVIALTDNVPESSYISATSEPAVSNEPVAPLSSNVEEVLTLELDPRAASQSPVMSGYESDSEGGLLTSAQPDQLAGHGAEEGGATDASADVTGAVASRSKDHVGIFHSLQDQAPTIPGAEEPVIALTDNVPPSTDIYPSSDLALGTVPPAALPGIGEEMPTHEADTDVVSGSPARSGYEPDSEAELTTEGPRSIGANFYVPDPAHEEATAVTIPLVSSEEDGDAADKLLPDEAMAGQKDTAASMAFWKIVNPDTATGDALFDTLEVVQSPNVSSLIAPAGKATSLPGDKEAAIAGSPAEGTAAVSPILVMQAARFDDGRTGSLPLLIEADAPALPAPAVPYSDAVLEGSSPVGDTFSAEKGPELLDVLMVPGLAGVPSQLDDSSVSEKEATIELPMSAAAEEPQMHCMILEAPVIGHMVGSAPNFEGVEVNNDAGGSPQTASATRSGSDALAMGFDTFSPGEDGSAGLLGSAFLGDEADLVVAEVQSSHVPANAPDQRAPAGSETHAEEDVEEHGEANGTGESPNVGTGLVDQAKATLAWMSTGVVDAVSAVANSASTLAAKDSPASPDITPPVTAEEPGDAPVISGEASSMDSVRAAGMAIAEKVMNVAGAFQARMPGFASAPEITEEDGLEETSSTREAQGSLLGRDGQGSEKTYSSDASGVGAGSHGVDLALSHDVDVASGSHPGDAGYAISTLATPTSQKDVSEAPAPQASGGALQAPATDPTAAGSIGSALDTNDQAAIANMVQGIFHRVASDKLSDVHSQPGKTGTPAPDSDLLVSSVLGQNQSADPKIDAHDVETVVSHDVDVVSGNQPVDAEDPASTLVTTIEKDVSTPAAPQASGVARHAPATDAASADTDVGRLDSHDHAAVANLVQGIFHRVTSDELPVVHSQQGETGAAAPDSDVLVNPVLAEKQSAGPKMSPFMATDKGVPSGVMPSIADTPEKPTATPVTPGLGLSDDDHNELDLGQKMLAPLEDHEGGAEAADRQQGPGIASRVLGLFGFGGLRRSADANMDVRRSIQGRQSEAELPDMPLMQSASPRIIPTGRRHKDRMRPSLASMVSMEFSEAGSLGLSRMNSVDTTASYASGNDILKSHPVEFESDVDEA